MKKSIAVCMLVFGLSFSFLGKAWDYLFAPVNCSIELVEDVVGATSNRVACLWKNITLRNNEPA